MQLTVSKESMLLALGRAQGIVGKKTTMPILSNILVEVLSNDRFAITATDLDIFSKGVYEGISEGGGRFCVNARDLHDIVRMLPAGNIFLEQEGDSGIKVTSGQIVYRLPTAKVSDYPSMPDFGEVPYSPVDPALFSSLIDHTLFSVGNDDPRIFLNGVNVEMLDNGKIRMVSTDGHRLSLIDRDMEKPLTLEHPVIVPRKGMVELRKLLDESDEALDIAFSGSNGFFRREDLLLVMRLIEGEFPDYNMVIPKSTDNIARVEKGAFIDALKRMSIVSAERSAGVRFHLSADELAIDSSDPEKGEGREVVPLQYEGEEVRIGFNARYFLDAVAVMSGEDVKLELSDELSPCIVRDAEDDGFLCVVMPVRIT